MLVQFGSGLTGPSPGATHDDGRDDGVRVVERLAADVEAHRDLRVVAAEHLVAQQPPTQRDVAQLVLVVRHVVTHVHVSVFLQQVQLLRVVDPGTDSAQNGQVNDLSRIKPKLRGSNHWSYQRGLWRFFTQVTAKQRSLAFHRDG